MQALGRGLYFQVDLRNIIFVSLLIESDGKATAANQPDDDVTIRLQLFHVSLGKMIYHFLANTIDTKGNNLIKQLAEGCILSRCEKKTIKEQKGIDAKVSVDDVEREVIRSV